MPIDPYIVGRAASRFPQAGVAVLTQSRPGLRSRSAAHAAFTAAQQHLANLGAAADYDDPELSPDLRPELRTELASQLRLRTALQFTQPHTGFIRVAERAHEEALAAAEKYRPKFDPESAAQAIRTDQAWTNHVKPMLEAGKGWDQIIPTLDVDGLLAVQRFAPGYEAGTRDRFTQDEVPAVLAGIQTASERRLLAVVSPEARAALQEAQDTSTALDYTRTVAGWIAGTDSRNAAAVSIGLKRATFEAGAQSPVDTSPEAQAAYEANLSGTPAAA